MNPFLLIAYVAFMFTLPKIIERSLIRIVLNAEKKRRAVYAYAG